MNEVELEIRPEPSDDERRAILAALAEPHVDGLPLLLRDPDDPDDRDG